jgi:UDP-N-acetylmuramoyl-L-alanyl-D-glutamate--2,6-diaminopimelate ligase
MAKKFTELLQNFTSISNGDSVAISGLAIDSKSVKPGDLFFAYPGTKRDGREFIADAIHNGAAAVVCEEHGLEQFSSVILAGSGDPEAWKHSNFYVHVVGSPSPTGMTHIPIIRLPDLQHKVGEIAARFYDLPTRDLQVIGITGTNGKTSISHFVAKFLELNSMHCGIIGTLGSGFIDNIIAGTHTTPSPIELQQLFAEFKKQQAKAIAMEVSSHSLVQGRVNGIDFHTAVFTNLTQDHLDYHGDMESYGQAKRLLFTWPSLHCAVINADDAFGLRLIDEFARKLPVIAYSLQNIDIPNVQMVKVTNLRMRQSGAQLEIATPWGCGEIATNLIGRFNISNLLAAIGAVGNLQLPFADLLNSVKEITPVTGRMQTIGGGDKPLVVVDYAHTPDALEKVLQNLTAHCEGKLWCVFGCGGDRDKTKRPIMAAIAEKHADYVIVTNDNPRTENPSTIANEIMMGFASKANIELELDRRKAINYAVTNANANDIVLIAGKGHEDYQIFGTEKTHFSDIEEAKKALNSYKL